MTAIGGHTRAFRGRTDEWLTPPDLIRALGEFDLDPCAAPDPRPWPTASTHITPPADGLAEKWTGRVWCNPPYGPALSAWLRRMAEHGSGIALTFARTETRAFRDHVWPHAAALFFVSKRLHFHDVSGARMAGNSGGPSVLIAYSEQDVVALLRSGIDGHLVRIHRDSSSESPSARTARQPNEREHHPMGRPKGSKDSKPRAKRGAKKAATADDQNTVASNGEHPQSDAAAEPSPEATVAAAKPKDSALAQVARERDDHVARIRRAAQRQPWFDHPGTRAFLADLDDKIAAMRREAGKLVYEDAKPPKTSDLHFARGRDKALHDIAESIRSSGKGVEVAHNAALAYERDLKVTMGTFYPKPAPDYLALAMDGLDSNEAAVVAARQDEHAATEKARGKAAPAPTNGKVEKVEKEDAPETAPGPDGEESSGTTAPTETDADTPTQEVTPKVAAVRESHIAPEGEVADDIDNAADADSDEDPLAGILLPSDEDDDLSDI